MESTIRKGNQSDLQELQYLFTNCVSVVCKKDYNEEQIKKWVSSVENKNRWLDVVKNQFLLVAEKEKQIVGFCSLDKGNYLDFLYVHKDYQRQGIANKLYAAIESAVIKNGYKNLTSDVSITAKPFFEKMGFEIIEEQIVEKENIRFNNFRMNKKL